MTRQTALIAAVALLLVASPAMAQPWCFPNTCTADTSASCSNAAMNTNAQISANSANSANQFLYLCCKAGPSGSSCVPDMCMTHTSVAACVGDTQNNCAALPGSGSSTVCIARDKLCLALPPRFCGKYQFCSNATGPCLYQAPSQPVSFDDGTSVNSKCPALHPMVVAMLALMFLTFVGGVVLVAVVVVRNQKQADEEEARAEAAAAAAAEAARQRRGRGGL